MIDSPIPPRQPAPAALQQHFEALRATPSDINEHMDVLRQYANRCEHVTEFGMRGGVSTVALLAAQPATLISWDINPLAVIHQHVADLLAVAGRTNFQPRVGSTLEFTIEPTDMLFIDTLHTYEQLKLELERHAYGDRVRKYLAFHDTATFGKVSEDGSTPGLRQAIYGLQLHDQFKHWSMVEDRFNCNGLVILRRD